MMEFSIPQFAALLALFVLWTAIGTWLVARYKDERDELRRGFDVRWRADMTVIKAWQDAHPGNDLHWPDHADLVVWLLEEREDARRRRGNLLFLLKNMSAENRRARRDLRVLVEGHEAAAVGSPYWGLFSELRDLTRTWPEPLCSRPPSGWLCTLREGHYGSCPTHAETGT